MNVGNGQCLALRNSDPANGVLMQTSPCDSSALQRWRMRSAPQDCTVRSSQWTTTEVCALQSTERMRGVMTNWHHRPFAMAWVDPEDYLLSHTVNTYLQVQPLKPDFSQGATGVEFGHRADRSTTATGSIAYSAYWLEWNGTTQRYRALSELLAPGSTTANGLNHTLMALGNGDAAQWDLLYDHNTVATTALQAGGSTRISRSSMAMPSQPAVTRTPAAGFPPGRPTGWSPLTATPARRSST